MSCPVAAAGAGSDLSSVKSTLLQLMVLCLHELHLYTQFIWTYVYHRISTNLYNPSWLLLQVQHEELFYLAWSSHPQHQMTPFWSISDRRADKQVVAPHWRIMVHSVCLCSEAQLTLLALPLLALVCLPNTNCPPGPLTSVIRVLLGMWAYGWKHGQIHFSLSLLPPPSPFSPFPNFSLFLSYIQSLTSFQPSAQNVFFISSFTDHNV